MRSLSLFLRCFVGTFSEMSPGMSQVLPVLTPANMRKSCGCWSASCFGEFIGSFTVQLISVPVIVSPEQLSVSFFFTFCELLSINFSFDVKCPEFLYLVGTLMIRTYIVQIVEGPKHD